MVVQLPSNGLVFLYGIYFSLLAYSLLNCYVTILSVTILAGIGRLYYFYYRHLKVSAAGRGVLITGCASGFGHQLATRLHGLGFTVFACCLNDQSDGGKQLREIGKDTGRMHVIKMDVTNDQEIEETRRYVERNLPELGLWAVVNNAGRSYVSFIEWLPTDVYEKILSTNLLGGIRVTKAFLPFIRKSEGRIVNVSSILGRLVTPWFVPYWITKHAIEAFSDGLRVEMAPFNVKVCVIEPGNFMAVTKIMGKEGADKSAREFWDLLDETTKQAYDKEKMDKWIDQRMDHFMKLSFLDSSPVIEAMADCVYRQHPKDRYFLACLNDRILAYIFQFAPTFISDWLNLYFTWN